MSWHADPSLLAVYARTPEALDAPSAASVEAHLLACGPCRGVVAAAADPAEIDRSWASIADVVDCPREPIIARPARLLGRSEASVRLVTATRPLILAWVGAVLGSAALAVWLARTSGSPGPYLLVAPLVPAFVVWLTFSPIAEPAGEVAAAAPMSGIGLVLRRLVMVEVPAVTALVIGALAVPDAPRAAASWLLPGLALAAACLALGTSVRMASALSMTVLVWVALVVVVAAADGAFTLADPWLFELPGQLLALVVAALGGAVCWRRRDRFATLEVTW